MRLAVVPFDTSHTEKPPCKWGQCGHCGAGRHDQCQFVRWAHLRTTPGPHGYLTDTKSRVVLPTTKVYVPGQRETWVCSCHTAGHDTGGEYQLDLFGGAA